MKGDFIENTVNRLQFDGPRGFTHAILNPPYEKINSLSNYRLLFRAVGIETVNPYSAFVALTRALMARGGQILAIIPRSLSSIAVTNACKNYTNRRVYHAATRVIDRYPSRAATGPIAMGSASPLELPLLRRSARRPLMLAGFQVARALPTFLEWEFIPNVIAQPWRPECGSTDKLGVTSDCLHPKRNWLRT